MKPGDFVSYYAKATDTDTVKGAEERRRATSISSRSGRSVRTSAQAQSQAGGGGGGGGGGGQQNQAGALSEQQRQIMSATYNVERDAEDDRRQVQGRHGVRRPVAEQAARRGRGARRADAQRLGGGGTENLRKIAELLPKAADEMRRPRSS